MNGFNGVTDLFSFLIPFRHTDSVGVISHVRFSFLHKLHFQKYIPPFLFSFSILSVDEILLLHFHCILSYFCSVQHVTYSFLLKLFLPVCPPVGFYSKLNFGNNSLHITSCRKKGHKERKKIHHLLELARKRMSGLLEKKEHIYIYKFL